MKKTKNKKTPQKKTHPTIFLHSLQNIEANFIYLARLNYI